jgi:hypothetical protein
LRGLRDELILFAEMHQQRGFQTANLAEVFFRLAAMLSNGCVDFVASSGDENHQPAKAISE